MQIAGRQKPAARKKQEPARFIAMSMAALVAASALWALMPDGDAGNMPRSPGPSAHAGHVLIPSGVPDQAGRDIDRAIARKKHAVSPGEQDAPGTAVDAIYRIEPATAPRKGDRIMT